jgi:hypothetical protein
MKRRDFLKAMSALGMAGAFPGMIPRGASAGEPFGGLALITVFAGGGWDQSAFCDPRENPEINHWAETGRAGVAGNLRFAPVAENAELFEKYYDRMLVVNGIDLQTNGHTAAQLSQHTGGLSGYPTLNAIYGASQGAGLPMPWLYYGGESQHLGVQPLTRLPDLAELRQLADSNLRDSARQFLRTSDLKILQRYRLARLEAHRARAEHLPFTGRKVEELYGAYTSRDLMRELTGFLPDEIDTRDLKGEVRSRISVIHRFLIAVQAGVCVTASVRTKLGFDTHANHDADHGKALVDLVRTLDYLWTKAEVLGVAHRLVVHVTSDVGRAPGYNGAEGKDHWSNGSSLIMMKNRSWTNRVVGMSGPAHEKVAIDPFTLQESPDGERLMSAHVHLALRRILGIDQHPLAQQYAFDVPEIDLLDPAVSSPVNVSGS